MRKIAFLFVVACAVCAGAQVPDTATLIQPFKFRSIGPAVTGGRIVDIEGDHQEPRNLFVASAAGGLFRSNNLGTTWTPVFDSQGTISIGDVAIAPSDSKVVWVGTGEHNHQRSSHWGDGVYKSEDGGTTWKNMGLRNILRTGRIAIDPKNPKVVFVAAMGPLYQPGGERGLFQTMDGGNTWKQVLKGENDTTGFIDVVIDPKNPKRIFAAAMDRLRRAWFIREGGPGSALYLSEDSGKTWVKIKGGLPEGDKVGRIGVKIYPKDPKIVYVTVDQTSAGGPAVFRSNDGGKSWARTGTGRNAGGSYYGQITIDPNNPDKVFVPGVPLTMSVDGGKTFRTVAQRIHVDHHAVWIPSSNSNLIVDGNDGGLSISHDGGATWDFVDNLPLFQMYAVGADMRTPYNVMGGAQDNGVWWGPSRSKSPRGSINSDWLNIYGGDGFYTVPDPNDYRTVYTSSQFGAFGRVDVIDRTTRSVRPRDAGLRCNWMTPFFLSPHNTRTVYWGAQKVFKSLNRGDSWVAISPDLTTNDDEKKRGNVPHCTITTMSESPVRAGVIWVGTDDGNVWVTQNDGVTWTQVNANISGAPKNWWISRIVASNFAAGTAYVTITGFREEIFTPLIFKTTDFGTTWSSIAGNLPNEPISVVREDNQNPKLLVVGTELGCYVSIDGGKSYAKFVNGLPTNAYQDLIIHPRDGDLILGTHGRGIFIGNITPLRQLTDEILNKEFHLFKPDRAIKYDFVNNMFDEFGGDRRFIGQNPEYGATIYYYLKTVPTADVTIDLIDAEQKVIRTFTGSKNIGINSVQWDLRPVIDGRRSPVQVPIATYGVRITVSGKSETSTVQIVNWEN